MNLSGCRFRIRAHFHEERTNAISSRSDGKQLLREYVNLLCTQPLQVDLDIQRRTLGCPQLLKAFDLKVDRFELIAEREALFQRFAGDLLLSVQVVYGARRANHFRSRAVPLHLLILSCELRLSYRLRTTRLRFNDAR
jgi:hypothetical protein